MAKSCTNKHKGRMSLIVGGVIVSVLVFVAIFAPWLSPHDPLSFDLHKEFAGPSGNHPFGNGQNGIDLMSQVFYGARLSLLVGLGSTLISALIGLTLGSFAGYLRGRFDAVLMRLVDVVFAFPGFLLNAALAAYLSPSVGNLMIALSITGWAGYARLMRGVSLGLREREFVSAAQALGGSAPHIVFTHLWPNLLAPLLVQMTFGVGGAIMVESSLSFLGLGVPPGTPSWGTLLNQGRAALIGTPHAIVAPGLALVLTILGLNLLGDGLRDRIDPKTK